MTKFSLQKLRSLVEISHTQATEKGFWNALIKADFDHKDQTSMLIVGELSEAQEALRNSRYANVDRFLNCETETTFIECFKEYVKDTFEDELADTFIRVCDYIGAYYEGDNIRLDIVHTWYVAEMENLSGTEIKNFSKHIFTIVRSITDIKYLPFPSQHVGIVLGKIHYLMLFFKKDMEWHIEQKLKYNKLRPHKHGKEF